MVLEYNVLYKSTYLLTFARQTSGDVDKLVDKMSRMQECIRNVKGSGKEVPHRGRGAKEHITHFHHDLSTETAAIRGRGGYPQYSLKKFVFGLVEISQVTLAMRGWGFRTPGLYWPAALLVKCGRFSPVFRPTEKKLIHCAFVARGSDIFNSRRYPVCLRRTPESFH